MQLHKKVAHERRLCRINVGCKPPIEKAFADAGGATRKAFSDNGVGPERFARIECVADRYSYVLAGDYDSCASRWLELGRRSPRE